MSKNKKLTAGEPNRTRASGSSPKADHNGEVMKGPKELHVGAEVADVVEMRAKHLAGSLGTVIRYRRTQQGLIEQKDLLSQLSFVKQSHLSDIENGKRVPKLEALLEICAALNISLAKLFHDAETTEPGGTPFRSYSRPNDSYDAKLGHAVAEKRWMAEFVASLLQQEYEGQTIGIDGGTTNEFIGEAIGRLVAAKQRTVSTIVTNNLGIPEAVSVPGTPPHVFLTAGRYRPERKTLIGREVVESIEKRPMKACVVGANGFDYPYLYTGGGSEDDLKLAYMKQAQEILIPLDPSKWGRQTAATHLASVKNLLQEPKAVSLITAYRPASKKRISNSTNSRHLIEQALPGVTRLLKEDASCRLDYSLVSLPSFPGNPLVLKKQSLSRPTEKQLQGVCDNACNEVGTEVGLVLRFRLERQG